jgi:hypothetical protein
MIRASDSQTIYDMINNPIGSQPFDNRICTDLTPIPLSLKVPDYIEPGYVDRNYKPVPRPFNPNISAGSSTPSTGAILGGLGATALGGLFGGASGASGVLGSLLDLYGSYQGSQANQNINQGLAQGYGTLSNQLQSQVQFKPFTVTGSTGGVSTGYDAQGNLQTQYGLGPQGQAIQQAGLGGAQH